MNPNDEILHIRKNTIIGKFKQIFNSDVLTTFNEDISRGESDDEQTINISVVTGKPKKTLKELGINLENEKLNQNNS